MKKTIIGLLLALLFYVLSFGPAAGLVEAGHLPEEVMVIYLPLAMLSVLYKPFGDLLREYIHLFV